MMLRICLLSRRRKSSVICKNKGNNAMKYFMIILITAFVFLSLGYGWAYKVFNKPVENPTESVSTGIELRNLKAISEAYKTQCTLTIIENNKIEKYAPADIQAQLVSSDGTPEGLTSTFYLPKMVIIYHQPLERKI